MVRVNTWGGKAGEAGGLHRAGVAALIAARSLTGSPVIDGGFPRGGPLPIAIELEADTEVDDLVCGLSDGGRWFIQAKRSCGKDGHLRASLKQWIAQPLEEQDRLGLAIRNAKGIMLDLGPALDKSRDGRTLTARERKAYTEVADLVRELGGNPSSVLPVAHSLTCRVETDRDEGSALVASILDAEVVVAGQGMTALDQLRTHFQQLATSGGQSEPETWITLFQQGGLDLVASSTGRTAQVIAALRAAATANRNRYRRQSDAIPLAWFADDLPPLPVPNLGDMHEVSIGPSDVDARSTGVRLDRVARRLPKFVLDGQPGSGKTTAVTQLCADLAADPSAPQPLYVQLRQVAPHIEKSSDVTLRLLVEAALVGLDRVDGHIISAQLAWMEREDHWLLVLDGLDETLAKRGLVTDGLLSLSETLAPNVGLILVTRHTGLAAVRKLQLPIVTLKSPRKLLPVLMRLIEHVAEIRELSDRSDWVRVRKSWVERSASEDNGLWRIPLTATLMTLSACRELGTLASPRKASLLKQGIEDSVRRWELSQLKGPMGHQDPELNQFVLLSIFTEISHILAEKGSQSLEVTLSGLKEHLKCDYGTSTLRASYLAELAVAFWVERMGTFVESAGQLSARHRHLVEVGDAMWVARQESEVCIAWLREALSDDVSEDRVALAVQLKPEIFRDLILFACDSEFEYRLRALEWSLIIAQVEPDPDVTSFALLGKAAVEVAARSAAPQREARDGLKHALMARKRTGAASASDSWYWIFLLLKGLYELERGA